MEMWLIVFVACVCGLICVYACLYADMCVELGRRKTHAHLSKCFGDVLSCSFQQVLYALRERVEIHQGGKTMSFEFLWFMHKISLIQE